MPLGPGQIKTKATRAPRKGQLPPSCRNDGSNKRYRGGGHSGQTESSERTAEPHGDQKGNKKMEQQAQEFDERRSANVDEYFMHFAGAKVLTMGINLDIAKEHRKQVDQVIADNMNNHPCCAAANSVDCLKELKRPAVVVVGFDHRFHLEIPMFQCRHCNEFVTVHPYAVDCVPTAPTEGCGTWIRRSVVHFFRDLHKNNGLSANGKFLRTRGHRHGRRRPSRILSVFLLTGLCFLQY